MRETNPLNSSSYTLKTGCEAFLTALDTRKNLIFTDAKRISDLRAWLSRNPILLSTNLICLEQYGDDLAFPSDHFVGSCTRFSFSFITVIGKYQSNIQEKTDEYREFNHCNRSLNFGNDYRRDYWSTVFFQLRSFQG